MSGGVLRPEHRSSPTWTALRAHLEARLAKLRADNDRSLADTQTENLRGRIAEIKDLLALDKDGVEFIE